MRTDSQTNLSKI